MNKDVVILLSGGIDSSSLAYKLNAEGYRVHALSINYGNRAQIELEYAKIIADKVCEDHLVMDMKDLRSAFVPVDGSVPKIAPYRNNIMVMIASAYAYTNGWEYVALGNHKSDWDSNDYTRFWDCGPRSNERMQVVLDIAPNGIKLLSPFINEPKEAVIAEGMMSGLNPDETLSCYAPIDGKACNECESCISRNEYMEKAVEICKQQLQK